MDILGLVLRWLHIFSAIGLFGGLIYQRLVLLPAVSPLGEEQRKALCERARPLWSRIVMLSTLFLIVSGLWNFFLTRQMFLDAELKLPKLYNMLFGIKFLLALAIFFFASALAGRGRGTQHFRDRPARWLSVCLLLATLVVGISGVLRSMHIAPDALLEKAAATETAHP